MMTIALMAMVVPRVRINQVTVGQHERKTGPDDEWDQDTDHADANCWSSLTPCGRHIDLQAGFQEQEEHAEPSHHIQHALLNRVVGEQELLQLGSGTAKQGRPQHYSYQNLSDYWGMPPSPKQFSSGARQRQQDQNLYQRCCSFMLSFD